MSVWGFLASNRGFLGSNTQKQSLWNIASLIAPKILVSYFQSRVTKCPKISSPHVKFWESYFQKSVFWKSWNYILGQTEKYTDIYVWLSFCPQWRVIIAHNDVWLLRKCVSVGDST